MYITLHVCNYVHTHVQYVQYMYMYVLTLYIIYDFNIRLQKEISDKESDHQESLKTIEEKYTSDIQTLKASMATLEASKAEIQKEVWFIIWIHNFNKLHEAMYMYCTC